MTTQGTEAIWYVFHGGNQFGPISYPDLKKLYSTGRIAPNAYVWSPQREEWTLATEVLGPPSVAVRPPPPPQKSVHKSDGEPTSIGSGVAVDIEPTQTHPIKTGLAGIWSRGIVRFAGPSLLIFTVAVGIWHFLSKGGVSSEVTSVSSASSRSGDKANECISEKSASCLLNSALTLFAADKSIQDDRFETRYLFQEFLRIARSSTDDQTFFSFARNTLLSLSNNPSAQPADNAQLADILFRTDIPSLKESAGILNPNLSEKLTNDSGYQCAVQRNLLKKRRFIELPAKFQEYYALTKGQQCLNWYETLQDIDSLPILRAFLSIAPKPSDKKEVAKRILTLESDKATAIALIHDHINLGEYSYLEKSPALRNEPLASVWEMRFFDSDIFLHEMLYFVRDRSSVNETTTMFDMNPDDRKEFLRLLSTAKFEKAKPFAEQVAATLRSISDLDGLKALATTSCKDAYSDFCAAQIGLACRLISTDQQKSFGEFVAARMNDAFLGEKSQDKPGTSSIGDSLAVFCPNSVVLTAASTSVLLADNRNTFALRAARDEASAGRFDHAYKMIGDIEPSLNSLKYYNTAIDILHSEFRSKGIPVLQARSPLIKAIEHEFPGRLLVQLLDDPLLVKDASFRINTVRFFMTNDINFVRNFVTWEKIGSGLTTSQRHDLITSALSMIGPEKVKEDPTALERVCGYVIDIDDASNLPRCLDLLPNTKARIHFFVLLADHYSHLKQAWTLYKPVQPPPPLKQEVHSKSASTSGAAQSIEGKWVLSSGRDKATVEFINSGTFLMTFNSEVSAGRWEALPDNRFVLRGDGLAALSGTKVCNYHFDGGDLVITDCPLTGRAHRL